MSFPQPDGTIGRNPPEGWVVWWRQRTREVCQQVILQRLTAQAEASRFRGVQFDQVTAEPSRVIVRLRAGKRKRGRR